MDSRKTHRPFELLSKGFLPEDRRENIYRNRRKIHALIARGDSATNSCVWLLERQNQTAFLVLSFLSSGESVEPSEHIVRLGDEGDFDLDEHIEKISHAVQNLDGRSNLFVEVRPIRSLVRINENEDLLGIVAATRPAVSVVHSIFKARLDTAAVALGALIYQGRSARRAATGEKIQEIISSGEDTSTSLHEIERVLSDACNANSAFQITMDANSEEHSSLIQIASNRLGNNQLFPSIARYEPLLEDDEKVDFGFIAVPILSAAFTLTSRPLGKRFLQSRDFDESNEYARFLILKGKAVEPFYGQVFSITDCRICESVRMAIDTYITQSKIEDGRNDLDDHFDALDLNATINTAELLQPIIKCIDVVSNIFVIDVSIDTTGKSDIRISSALPSTTLAQQYVQRMRKYLELTVFEAVNDSESKSKIGIDVAGKKTYIEILIQNRVVPARLIVIELKSATLPHLDFYLVKYALHLLENYYKERDAMRLRAALLAQTRHAISHTISVSLSSIDNVGAEYRFHAANPIRWEKLRINKSFGQSIERSRYHVNQTAMVAETGRYLFSELGPQTIKSVHFDIARLTSEVHQSFLFAANEKGRSLRLSISGQLPSKFNGYVTGDSLLIWIAISNLLDNAIKYSRSGTEISVRLKYFEETYRFSVSNLGDYLSAEVKPLIFSEYLRGRGNESINRTTGTGIGLPVADKILTAHGPAKQLDYISSRPSDHDGDVWETVFSFELPYRTGVHRKIQSEG